MSRNAVGGTCPTHRILVVDDDLQIRQYSAKMLTRSGYHVDAAADGADGWEALKASRYDLLITDNDMSKVTGVELIKKLHSARMAVPVILASGAMPEETLSLPLAAMLLKPFTSALLLGTVRQVLRATECNREPMEPAIFKGFRL